MTKAQLGARIRAKKKINADLSPSPNRKRRKVADPAKEARSQGVALFSDDEQDELAPLDRETQGNIWLGLKENCENFLELPAHMDPNDASTTHRSKLAWIQLKKGIENAMFLMKSRRVIISKGTLVEHNLAHLLYACVANAPEKKLIKEILMRLKGEMQRLTKRRESGIEAGAQVTDEDMQVAIRKFTDAFNAIDQRRDPVPESRIEEYATSQAEACQASKGNFHRNRDTALDTWNQLNLEQKTKLLKKHFHTSHWNFANLIHQQPTTLISTISNSVGNIILESTQGQVIGSGSSDEPLVSGGPARGSISAQETHADVQRLSGPSSPSIVFDMANLAPPSSASKKFSSKSAAALAEKADKKREKERKEAARQAKEQARIEEEKAEKLRQRKKKAEAERAKKNKERYADKMKKKAAAEGKEKKPRQRSRSPSL